MSDPNSSLIGAKKRANLTAMHTLSGESQVHLTPSITLRTAFTAEGGIKNPLSSKRETPPPHPVLLRRLHAQPPPAGAPER